MATFVGTRVSGWWRFTIAMILCVVLLLLESNTNLLQPVRASLYYTLVPVRLLAQVPGKIANGFDSAISNDGDVLTAYENLHDEYFKLKAELLKMRSLQAENVQLRSLLDASQDIEHKIELAELLEVSLDPYQHRVMIDRGATSGVYVGQAIIDDKGVVGQVTRVLPYSAAITLITDPSHAIPVQVERTGLRALAYGTGDLFSLKVPFLNENPDIQEGDRLLSSGLGGRFPAGYPVAVIQSIKSVPGQAFSDIKAGTIAQVNKLRQVLLLSPEPVSASSRTALPLLAPVTPQPVSKP